MSPQPAGNQVPTIPFRYGTLPQRTVLDQRTATLAAGNLGQYLQAWDAPKQGFARRIRLYFAGTDTTGATAPTLQEDYPDSLASLVELRDPNGTPFFSLTGFQSVLHDMVFNARPGAGSARVSTNATLYSGPNAISATNAWAFNFDIPLAVNDRDTLGVLPNEDPNRGYTINVKPESLASVYTANAPTALVFNCTPVYEYYTKPPVSDAYGNPYEAYPPHLGAVHRVGVSKFVINTAGSGPGSFKAHLKPGDLIRGMILVFRSNGTRATYQATPFTGLRFLYGNNTPYLTITSEAQLLDDNFERLGYPLPSGCYFLDFTGDSGLRPGLEGRRELFNSAEVADMWFEVDLPGGFNLTNASLEVIVDSILVPAGMVIM